MKTKYRNIAEAYAEEHCVCQDGGLSEAGCEIVAAGANCDHMVDINHTELKETLWDMAYGQAADYTAWIYELAYDDLFASRIN